MKLSHVASALALALALPGVARAQAFDETYQTWTSVTVQGNVTPDVQLYVDVNARFFDFDDDFHPYQLLLRPGVGYRLTDGMYAWVAYAWTPSWNREHVFTDEHRIWEQWSYDIPGLPSGLRLFLRTRLEERFRPELSSDVALRLRQFVRLIVPFAPSFPLHASIWDEAFFGLTDSGTSPSASRPGTLWQRAGFDQNRLFLGVGVSIPDGIRVEVGYLNHWIVRPTADEIHHVLAVNAFVTIR
jgi:hypothetical protein